MEEITLTREQFAEVSASVAAELSTEISEEVDPMKGFEVSLLTALFCAKLHRALFLDDDEVEVEE